MTYRLCFAIGALFAASPAYGATTYVELLHENVAERLRQSDNPEIPNELELNVMTCLMDAFLAANIPADDLAKLDQAVAAGTIGSDELAGHYRMLASDPDALNLMAQEASGMCRDVMEVYEEAKTGN